MKTPWIRSLFRQRLAIILLLLLQMFVLLKEKVTSGVKIYEYSKGFIHSKTFVSDDEVVTVGTTNLDFRSLYLHFECGVWMYKSRAVEEVKADFLSTLEHCHPITQEDCKCRFVCFKI